MSEAEHVTFDDILPGDNLDDIMAALRMMNCQPEKIDKPDGDHLYGYEVHFATRQGTGVFGISDFVRNKRKSDQVHGYLRCRKKWKTDLSQVITHAMITSRAMRRLRDTHTSSGLGIRTSHEKVEKDEGYAYFQVPWKDTWKRG